MIEAWEAKEKRAKKLLFEICENKIGSDFYVYATLPNREPETIYGFAIEADAARWIRNESVVWLNQLSGKLNEKGHQLRRPICVVSHLN